jgi:hypothetical protein
VALKTQQSSAICTLKFPFVIHLRVVFIYADVNQMLADVLKSIGRTINRLVNSVVSNSSVTLLNHFFDVRYIRNFLGYKSLWHLSIKDCARM